MLRDNDGDLFASAEYQALIPSDASWVHRPLCLARGMATEQAHRQLIDDFTVPDGDFAFKSDLVAAVALLKKWHSWRDGAEWRLKSHKDGLRIWSATGAGDVDVDVVKGEAVLPFASPLVVGLLLNPAQRSAWDTNLDSVRRLCKSSEFSSLIYISVKTPTLITYRDFVALNFCYPLPDGSCLVGARSVAYAQCPPKRTRVRATIHLDAWHVRPLYGGDMASTHTKVCLYLFLLVKKFTVFEFQKSFFLSKKSF